MSAAQGVRGRFAPSPTGPMHLGNARTALLAWLSARSAAGAVILRIEDLDRARLVPGAEAGLLEDLAWLGLDWDEGPDRGGAAGPYRQSDRTALYQDAIRRLAEWVYPCACSRAEIARAPSAPYAEDEDGPRYPGTCRDRPAAEVDARARAQGRPPALRFRGQGERIAFTDAVHGAVEPLGEAGVDDFVLRRSDGCAAYQLAVVVDDGAMAVTEVVRGEDLLRSTPRQIAIARALGLPVPAFAHVPLVLSPGGGRLGKRTRPLAIRDLRARGVTAERVVGALAASAGLGPEGVPCRPRDLVGGFDLGRLARTPAVLDDF